MTFITRWIRSNVQKIPLFIVVSTNVMPLPQDSGVCEWNGSSCVAISPRWAITARHTWGNMSSTLAFRGEHKNVVQIVVHPDIDLQLIEFDPPVTTWYPVRSGLEFGDQIFIASHGLYGTSDEDWSYPRTERWGTNTYYGGGFFAGIDFTEPSDESATQYEASCAMNDSGGGFLKEGLDGKRYLHAVIVSLMRSTPGNRTSYGSTCFALDLSFDFGHGPEIKNWIYETTSRRADYNEDGLVTVDDIHRFLDEWHLQSIHADINNDRIVTVDDIFDFLNRWFQPR